MLNDWKSHIPPPVATQPPPPGEAGSRESLKLLILIDKAAYMLVPPGGECHEVTKGVYAEIGL